MYKLSCDHTTSFELSFVRNKSPYITLSLFMIGLYNDESRGSMIANSMAYKYRWVTISLWMINHSISWIPILCIGLLLPSMASDLDMTYFQQGLIASAPVWVGTILYLPTSMYSVAFSPRLITNLSLIAGIILILVQASASVFIILFIARLAFGLPNAFREAARAQITRALFKNSEIVFVNGLTAFIITCFYFIGSLLIPTLLELTNDSWRTTLVVFGGLSFFLTTGWIIWAQKHLPQPRDIPNSFQRVGLIRNALAQRAVWIGALAFCGVHISWSAFSTFYPTLMFDRLQISLQHSALILAVEMPIAGIIGLGVGFIAKTWKQRSFLFYISGILLPCKFLLLLWTDSIPFLLVISMLGGMLWGFFPIILSLPYSIPRILNESLPVAHSFNFTSMALGVALGPAIAGALYEPLGDLGLTLIYTSLFSLTLCLSGLTIRNLNDD